MKIPGYGDSTSTSGFEPSLWFIGRNRFRVDLSGSSEPIMWSPTTEWIFTLPRKRPLALTTRNSRTATEMQIVV